MFFFVNSSCSLFIRTIFILPKLDSLIYMKAAVVLVYMYLLLRNSFRNQEKVFKTSANARPHCPLTHLFFAAECISAIQGQTTVG